MFVYFGRNCFNSYILGRRLGCGGEGEVYEIAGNHNLVAKIYFDSKFNPSSESPKPRQELKEKIETMLDQPVDPYINGVLTVAWPQDILTNQQGQFVGYIMPRVNSKYHIFAASRERERVKLYPNYTWRTAITIAYNLALAVKVVHNTNAIIGDMNPNNIMIDEKGYVTLIDTDSFNITNKRTGKIYKCSVGVPEMLAPELQGKNLAKDNSIFTKQTDSFALSIHIFNMLMNNCHPFGCVGLNKSQSSSSNNPIVHNIVKGNCPYVTNGSGTTSPDAPDVMMLPKEIRQLFDRTFRYSSSTAVQSVTISKRPSAEEWQNALGRLYKSEMMECQKDVSGLHLYPASYSKCPWCDIKHLTIPVSRINSVANTKQTGTNNPYRFAGMGNVSTSIHREAWSLWLICICIGLVSGPFMAQFLVPICYDSFDFELSYEAAYVILAIVGGISGAIIAHYGQESYQKAYKVWPWLLLGLLVPFGTALIIAAVMLVIFLIIIAITVILYIIGAIIVIAFICGMCSDS